MRNLKNIQRSTIRFTDKELPLTATAWDTVDDSLICAFGPTEANVLIELRRVKSHSVKDEPHQLIASWDAPCPHPDLPCDSILNLHYFSDSSITCLILAGGDIVIVREKPSPGENLLEIIGSVDAGILAAAWSPDEELLTICTKADTLLFMSRTFENIADITLSPEDVNVSNHVSVGWGKVETQFKGKRAKALRDPTMPETVDEGLLSIHDDGKVRISWRGDGAYVAINSVESGKRRMIRVYSREGTLDSVSEPVDGVEGPLSWRPAGNLIGGIRRLETSIEVVFFERNGLRHGEFPLRLTQAEMEEWGSVKDVSWNVDSTVLAVSFIDRVQLWTMGNYHYYLKQEIRLHSLTSPSIQGMSWHPEKSLHFVGRGIDEIFVSDLAFSVAKGPTSKPYDYGIAAVIDGALLKLTPLRNANVPPPMALHEIQLDHNVIDVAISQSSNQLAVLDLTRLSVYNYGVSAKVVTAPNLSVEYPLPDGCGKPLQIAWKEDKEIFVLTHKVELNQDAIYSVVSDTSQWTMLDLEEDHIATIFPSQEYDRMCFQSNTGLVFDASSGSRSSSTIPIRLPVLCPWSEMVSTGDEQIVFGLSRTGNLYANSTLLVSNCTSFLVTRAHLIFTTSQHLLKFVHLTAVEALEIPANEPEKDERCRSIERGARLLTVMPSSYSLVMQMPRGNLETIYPRALVLAGIRESIATKNYKKAFLACRNHRVDMNILHDYAPQQFMDNVGLFVDQIKKVEHIDLFLSQLRDEDVSQTMYKETIATQSKADGDFGANVEVASQNATFSVVPKSKTNLICDAFLKILHERTSDNLQNIVTANVCKCPPDLEGGLSVIARLREENEAMSEKTAEYICFLADVNQLYDTALGMYNLDLTLLMAQQSQKDPREYLPYLQSLQEQEPVRRRFTIDNDLGRYEKALAHLHSLDAFIEVEKYAEKHELYSAAIDLYKYQEHRLNALMRLYADHLTTRNKFKEAGIAYEFLKDYTRAIPAYRQANLWREALSCATTLPLSPSSLKTLAQDLAVGLAESKEYQDAATIYMDYLNNVEEASKNLCKAYNFAEAIRLTSLHKKPTLLTEIIDSGLTEAFTTMTELLADCKSQLTAQIPRIRELRVKKKLDPLAFFAGDATTTTTTAIATTTTNDDFPDDISLASTTASAATTSNNTFMTRYTTQSSTGTLNSQATRKTSKNKKREERKRARGKKGSVYEEEYLVNSVGRLIERVNASGADCAGLVVGLVRRGMRERAVVVERAMVEVVDMCRAVVDEVFVGQLGQSASAVEGMMGDVDGGGGSGGGGESGRPLGGDGVLWDAMEGIGTMTKPVVKAFERLTLLA